MQTPTPVPCTRVNTSRYVRAVKPSPTCRNRGDQALRISLTCVGSALRPSLAPEAEFSFPNFAQALNVQVEPDVWIKALYAVAGSYDFTIS